MYHQVVLCVSQVENVQLQQQRIRKIFLNLLKYNEVDITEEIITAVIWTQYYS